MSANALANMCGRTHTYVQGAAPSMSGDNGLDLLIRRFSNDVGNLLLVTLDRLVDKWIKLE